MKFVKGHKRNVTHNMAYTRQYNTWNHMMSRCYRKKDSVWVLYGKRGIKVIKKWHKFERFWEDLEPTYFKGAIIDRINNNKGYSKSNCRWVSIKQSINNRRCTIKIYFNKEKHTLMEWCQLLKINYHRTYLRLYKYGWTTNNAFTKPNKYN